VNLFIQKITKFVNPKTPIEVKKEVYDYIVKLYRVDKNITVDFRSYKSAIDARVGNPQGWKSMVKLIVGYKGGDIKESYLIKLNYMNMRLV